MNCIILFGGSGFVGTHLAPTLLNSYSTVYIADIRKPCWHPGTELPPDDRLKYIECDVRQQIDPTTFPGKIECIVNLAAVHTSPGHPSHEYFEANILGAQNVCTFAEKAGCNRIIFTSSISVYGPGEDEKNESMIPMPMIPYGSSKIIAEYIHREWFNAATDKRALTIIRPGVIFGKGEGGNFTRIANALQKGIFAYPGRKDTIKACLYVKDICAFIKQKTGKRQGYEFYNFCYSEKYTIKDIVKAFKRSLRYNAPEFVIPFRIITMGAALVNLIPLPFIKKMGLVPERIQKLIKSTNISSQKLVDSGFSFGYTLDEALKDWSKDCGGGTLY